MNALRLALVLLMPLAGCFAKRLPAMQQQYPTVPSDDPGLQEAQASIDASALDQAHKIIAKSVVRQLNQCGTNLENYASQLTDRNAKNGDVASFYDWANAIVGAVGTATAPATIASAWALFAPGVAFVWDVFGITTLKSQVQPKVNEGKTAADSVTDLRSSVSNARDAFLEMVLSKNSNPPTAAEVAAADAKFDPWNRQASGLIKRLSDKGICRPPTAR